MIYLDTCALVKLVWVEESSGELVTWLEDHENESIVSSMLADVELRRAVWRVDPGAMPAAELILAELTLLPIDAAVVRGAGQLSPPYLRSLDAIHLATVMSSPRAVDITYFVTYDKRLLQAAAEVGLPAFCP